MRTFATTWSSMCASLRSRLLRLAPSARTHTITPTLLAPRCTLVRMLMVPRRALMCNMRRTCLGLPRGPLDGAAPRPILGAVLGVHQWAPITRALPSLARDRPSIVVTVAKATMATVVETVLLGQTQAGTRTKLGIRRSV